MNNNQLANQKVEVPQTPELNDCDILTSALACEKSMVGDLSIALTEASNKVLLEKIFSLYTNSLDMHREIFELLFSKGWYKLEKAEVNKIGLKYNELNGKTQELV